MVSHLFGDTAITHRIKVGANRKTSPYKKRENKILNTQGGSLRVIQMIVIFACSIAKPVQMTRTPRSQRRKNSKLLREDGVNRLPRSDTETSPSSQHSASPAAASAAASGVVDKGSSHELEEATRPLKHGGKKKRHSLQPGNHIVDGRGKKRPRSHSKEEVDKDGHEDDPALPASSDKLVASIEAHDRFFSLMLDMIPESFVLPAKQTAESAYSSKYMKVTRSAGRFTRRLRPISSSSDTIQTAVVVVSTYPLPSTHKLMHLQEAGLPSKGYKGQHQTKLVTFKQ